MGLEKRRKEMKEMRKAGKTRKLAELRGQTLEGLVASAKQRGSIHDATSGVMGAVADRGVTDTSAKAYYREFKKVVDAADVVLEVLDARDPLGSRCKEVEQGVVVGGGKRLVLVLNKADLVPRENLQAWVKYLRNEYPTIAFKASTQNTARLFLAGSLGHTAQLGLRKSRRKSLASSRRLDITQLLFHSSPSPGGMETTCCRPVRIWTGTRVGLSSARKERPTVLPSSRLLILSSPPQDLPTSPLGCLFRMFTKLEVSEQFQWVVSRLVSSSPAWSLLSLPIS